MNITLPQAVFLFLAAVIVVCSILTVTTKRILRSATYLLFVLFATAGIYFELNYSFLGAVQLTVYAGGIIVLYVFSILLTSSDNKKADKIKNSKFFAGILAAVGGAALCIFITLTHSLNSMEITMEYYLVISTIMFFAGIYGFMTRRNMLAVLISIELILNSVDINFVAFNRFLFPDQLEGFFFTLFAIGISACETAVAIAIIINIYRNIRNIQVKNLNKLKD